MLYLLRFNNLRFFNDSWRWCHHRIQVINHNNRFFRWTITTLEYRLRHTLRQVTLVNKWVSILGIRATHLILKHDRWNIISFKRMHDFLSLFDVAPAFCLLLLLLPLEHYLRCVHSICVVKFEVSCFLRWNAFVGAGWKRVRWMWGLRFVEVAAAVVALVHFVQLPLVGQQLLSRGTPTFLHIFVRLR